ncbi:MAG: DUF5615 family PIN-like protein [Bacteroidota bacterium]
MMRLLANENFPKSSIDILKNSGLDIISIGIDYVGIQDDEVMKIAIKEDRTIFTFDRDYGELIFKKGYKPAAGVIYLRWEDFQPEDPGNYLMLLFETRNINFRNSLTVITENSIRQRKYSLS